MRATELLVGISINPFSIDYQGIYFSEKQAVKAITAIYYDHPEHRLLFNSAPGVPITMKDLLTALMLHKKYKLFKPDGTLVFGYREDNGKIII